MKSIYAVVATGAKSGKFYTVMAFEGLESAEAHAARLREVPEVAVEVISTPVITD